MKQLLQEYADYNVWANEIIISFIKQLSPEQLNKEQLSSFTTIRKTVEHTAGAEHNWLKRINSNLNQENKAIKKRKKPLLNTNVEVVALLKVPELFTVPVIVVTPY